MIIVESVHSTRGASQHPITTDDEAREDLVLLTSAPTKLAVTATGARTFGWKDLLGDVTPKAQGAGSPTLVTWSGNQRGWAYAAGDDGDNIYHLPHDYALGTDLYFHPHWIHNGTDISGSLVINIYFTYAKGHQQASFHVQKTATITESNLTIGNTPALWHRIPEIQISTPGGSASKLDTDLLEPDGLISVNYDVTTIPTITGGAAAPILLTMDIHYQCSTASTLNKAPNFYA